ncbi:hypothetical protein G6F57_005465 [Rhizopus arrhizus]|uniref:F-box domain-containing protein n=1 Tax=Rhizopus oryzae TaxID=64495 RepID=A0A9P6XBS4_RHIOR|nr:hypothetical protein G6F24_012547 [Rhizopus arrhizus]KAG1428924.1 hypothetical protein G6F58_000327 [Rhizopus delemar]KAG0778112.1 hypothetical protein G6F22_011430 [Rhizopus arrhizus]KAG0816350.1 hypothetical protein G6F20_003266 [Rhizopus arrhizus]KAG0836826.1 hypothetical protein G6F18_005173 [Rhizopus arrhizus]
MTRTIDNRHHDRSRGMRPILFLHLFPYEVTYQILSYLDFETLIHLLTVSKSCYRLARSNEAWKRLCLNRFRIGCDVQSVSDWQDVYQQHHVLNTRWTQGKVSRQNLRGHLDSVYCLQFHQDILVTGSRDQSIKLWDLKSKRCLKTLYGHDGSVLCLRYTDAILVSGSSDRTVIVWDHHRPVQRLYGHTAGVLDVCVDDRCIVSCSKDHTIRVWDRQSAQLVRTIRAHQGPVNAIGLVGDRLVSASGDTMIKMWDVRTGRCLREFAGHTRGLACVKYDGTKIVSGSSDKMIKVWEAEVRQRLIECACID